MTAALLLPHYSLNFNIGIQPGARADTNYWMEWRKYKASCARRSQALVDRVDSIVPVDNLQLNHNTPPCPMQMSMLGYTTERKCAALVA